jgi:23S rRNA (adenine2030-N6)-methyltransferase
MNYRHEFHAGNFADVVKHVILTRILLYLTQKETAFRFLDTHAGSGIYDLYAVESAKTSEWKNGIGRLTGEAPVRCRLSDSALELIEPYLRIVGALGNPALYPGSPAIAARLLRPGDRMIFCELHPRARANLNANLGRDRRAKIIEIDGFIGLKAFVPPVERRGLVLIDPPFEARDEFSRMAQALATAWHKWPTGIYMLWYPIKDPRLAAEFAEELVRSNIKRLLRLEIRVDNPQPGGPLVSCGLIIVNPPFSLVDEIGSMIPSLLDRLSLGKGAGYDCSWLTGE